MQFHRGQDWLFTTEELLAGFQLILDAPTARRAVHEWLNTFGFCVSRDRIMEPGGGWEAHGGEDATPSVAGSIAFSDPAAFFLESLHGAPMADDLAPLIQAVFVRYTHLHYFLVVMASPRALERFKAAGIDLAGLPQTPEERDEFLTPIAQMSGL